MIRRLKAKKCKLESHAQAEHLVILEQHRARSKNQEVKDSCSNTLVSLLEHHRGKQRNCTFKESCSSRDEGLLKHYARAEEKECPSISVLQAVSTES